VDRTTSRIRCIGCGGLVPEIEGPTHHYMDSSPGCWRVFGEVLAREFTDPAYGALHRLTADTFAVQHPGRPGPQSIQSVCVHLISLCMILERGVAPRYATRALASVVKSKHYFWLTPPPSLGAITVVDVAGAATPDEHLRRVRTWAASAWAAWASYHGTIRGWIPEGVGSAGSND
jgi:uncharacterized protein DUF5946